MIPFMAGLRTWSFHACLMYNSKWEMILGRGLDLEGVYGRMQNGYIAV